VAQGSIKFIYAPAIATVSIDGVAVKPATNVGGVLKVDSGPHDVTVSMAGFTTYSTSLVVEPGKTSRVMNSLEPNTAATANWYTTHPADQQARELMGGIWADEEQDNLDKRFPVWKALPIGAPGMRADYGEMAGAKGGSGYGIYATRDPTLISLERCKSLVTYDISVAGYSPDDYTIKFQLGTVPEPTYGTAK
jgi:hypothetical protein